MVRSMSVMLWACILLLVNALTWADRDLQLLPDTLSNTLGRAATEPPSSQKWALIIGVDRFDDPNIGTLRYTVSDAKKLYQTLTTIPNGFPKHNVILMTPQVTDSNHRPTRNNIIAMLTTWLDLATSEDLILVYFSGHGLEVDGESYLVSSDAKLSNPALTAIPVSFVKSQMRHSKASQRLLILDACHSGEGKSTPRMGQAMASALNDAEGMVMLASCGLEETSYEMRDQPHGAFTYFLIEALTGAADRDRNGAIWASEAYWYTYHQTSRWAAAQGLKQRPKWVAAIQGEIVLVEDVPETPSEQPESMTPDADEGLSVSPTPSVESSLPPRITGKDAADMVLIPAGEFQMGNEDGENNERPIHMVWVAGFYMDTHEVTVGQYKRFVQASGHQAPDWTKVAQYSPTDQHPIIHVSWHDALAYCEWAEKRLPTEAEWEKAARGGLVGKRFPWGDAEPDASGRYRANYDPGDDTEDGHGYTAPVGSFSANGYGLYDMAGNVWEWCMDWYDSAYYANSPKRNPQGSSSGSYRVLRGGSWNSAALILRVANRNHHRPRYSINNGGFRCAQDVR